MSGQEVSNILQEIGILLELTGDTGFRARAYQNAARVIESLDEPLEKVVAEGRLSLLRGIGDGLRQKITELVATGKLAYYEELKGSVPPGLLEMLQIPSLGPKKVRALYEQLEITTVNQLETLCQAGKVATLTGFGDKTQAKILEGISFRRLYASHHLLIDASVVALPMLEKLRQQPEVIRCSTAGSLRRSKEVVGDIDFVVSSDNPTAVLDGFVKQPGLLGVLVRGETKASVILAGGIQADLRVVSDSEFPFTLNYFTGSKEHNIAMRQRAIQRGFRLNEYGLYISKEETKDPALLIPCKTEEDIYRNLGLSYVEPELREDQGEFAAASEDKLPKLLEVSALKGSLHNHTDWSDGQDSLEVLASQLGAPWKYWAITDHSRSSFQANGLHPDRLRKQLQAIRETNKRLEDSGSEFRLLTGVEVDIIKSGLDLDDDLLAELDVVVASLHIASQDEAENTQRIIYATQNPYVHMIGHPSGRLLLKRQPHKVNLSAVIDACAETGTWLEINAQPTRLDLDWRLWKQASSKGIMCAINCDAHSLADADYLQLGARIARKGWLTNDHVVNTLGLAELKLALLKKRQRFGCKPL
jgi:DNA polymerase (family X)